MTCPSSDERAAIRAVISGKAGCARVFRRLKVTPASFPVEDCELAVIGTFSDTEELGDTGAAERETVAMLGVADAYDTVEGIGIAGTGCTGISGSTGACGTTGEEPFVAGLTGSGGAAIVDASD